MTRIGIVAGEESGDILGASLMRALKREFPDAQFEGIGGPRMLALGFQSFYPLDRLAVMGLVEPLRRLPELLRIRRHLKDHFSQTRPAVFIGIDSPDFNLNLELHLRCHGVKTVHYVSPSVWAWRQGRIKTIARAVDLMLTLFPFESDFYRRHKVPVQFVGHPLADEFPLETDSASARKALGVEDWIADRKLVALLPGSRASEVGRLGQVFLAAAREMLKSRQDLCFVVPSANERRHEQLQALLQTSSQGLLDQNGADLSVKLVRGQSQQVMAACDVVLMASGTTSLEALLLKRPMVIAYKMAPMTYSILRRLVKTRHIGLPNLLTEEPLVAEYIQDAATADALSNGVLSLLNDEKLVQQLQRQFLTIHQQLRRDASAQAALAIKKLVTE